jgi:hypothetical protein
MSEGCFQQRPDGFHLGFPLSNSCMFRLCDAIYLPKQESIKPPPQEDLRRLHESQTGGDTGFLVEVEMVAEMDVSTHSLASIDSRYY